MPVVNPGIRRFLGSAIQRLFNGASFSAPLTHSAIPTRAASGTTGTFTRATASTWRNNDGYLVAGLSGEIGFVGARRIENLWTTSSVSLASGANKSLTLAAGTYAFSMGAGTGTATFSGTGGATGTLAASASGRVSVNKTITAGTFVVTASVADLADLQVESLTAQTTQTAGEYVSVGVPSDWAGTELVTNGTFDSATTGWTADALSGADSVLSIVGGKLRVTNTGATYGCAYQTITTVVGAKYVVWGEMTLGTCPQVSLRIGSTGFASYEYYDVALTATGIWTTTFTATTTTTTLTLLNRNDSGAYSDFDNISVKPAYYHGSMVDGVKCFATDINGAAIPSTTLLGYQAEGARTNLCLQSNAFTTTWTALGIPAVTQNVVGPDGATSAWTLTDDAGGVVEGIYQGAITLTAATYTYSIFVKKTNTVPGTNSYPLMYATQGANIALCTIDPVNGTATVWTTYAGPATVTSSATCVSYNANYWRVSLTFLATAAAWIIAFLPAAAASGQSTGVENAGGTGSQVIYGAQVELGSFASSYIPTTTVAVARNADVLKYSGGDISALANLYGEFIWRGAIDAGTNFTLFELNDGGTTTNSHVLRLEGATAKLRAFAYSGSALQLVNDHTNAFVAGTQYKTSSYVVTNDAASMLNGADRKTDTSCTPPAGTLTLAVGCNIVSVQQFSGNIRNFRGWLRGFSASEQTAITS